MFSEGTHLVPEDHLRNYEAYTTQPPDESGYFSHTLPSDQYGVSTNFSLPPSTSMIPQQLDETSNSQGQPSAEPMTSSEENLLTNHSEAVQPESLGDGDEPVVFLTSVSGVPVTRPSDADAEQLLGATGGSQSAQYDVRNVSYPQFATAQSRRATYTEWSPDHPLKPDDLVHGGFFYAGKY